MGRPKANTTFMDRVNEHSFIDGDGCHIFCGHLNEDGYGRINSNGKLIYVHREIWKLNKGPIPHKLYVCHKCDKPACWNKDHLYVGTQFDNMRDRKERGRYAYCKGSKNNSSKLNEEKVRAIKKRLANNETAYSIARDYNVTGEAILHIKHGRYWKHVA